jgi:hypothetical protein
MNFELDQLLVVGNQYAQPHRYTSIVGQVVKYKKYHRDVKNQRMHLIQCKNEGGRWMVAEEDLMDMAMTNEQASILLHKEKDI